MGAFFTSDWHLGHKNILKFRFSKEDATTEDVHNHALELINNYKSMINKRDVVYWLGDVVFDKQYLPMIKELPGRKILILGNHDTEFISTRELLEVFDDVLGCKKYKMFWLSHFPVHESELRGKLNIHGHTHNINITKDKMIWKNFNLRWETIKVPDERYINVCVEQTNMFPISLDEIMPLEKRNEYKEKMKSLKGAQK